MKSLFLLISAFAAVPGWVSAQPGAADPAAQVPAVVYRSVFADTATGVEMESTDWKAANGAVGQFTNGHVDILKWEAAQEQKKGQASMPMPMPMPHAAPAPATGAGAAKP